MLTVWSFNTVLERKRRLLIAFTSIPLPQTRRRTADRLLKASAFDDQRANSCSEKQTREKIQRYQASPFYVAASLRTNLLEIAIAVSFLIAMKPGRYDREGLVSRVGEKGVRRKEP